MPGWAKGKAVNVTITSQLLQSGGWRKTMEVFTGLTLSRKTVDTEGLRL